MRIASIRVYPTHTSTIFERIVIKRGCQNILAASFYCFTILLIISAIREH